MIEGLPGHLEAYLGPIVGGWKFDGFQVVAYEGQHSGGRAYSTMGLSRHGLRSPKSGKIIYHELLTLFSAAVEERHAVDLLGRIGGQVVEHHVPLLRGDVVGASGPVLPKTHMEGLYVTLPVYLPDEFATYSDLDREVIVAWLVPITKAEVAFVDANGWSLFEDLLVERDPDLVDVNRPSVI